LSEFSESWLSLREPLDTAARDAALVATLAAALPARPLVVTDLAAGTGANLRYLVPRLGGEQHWRLIDHDAALLDAVPARLDAWARGLGATLTTRDGVLDVCGSTFVCRVERIRLDLVRGIDSLDVPPRSLVTASALLDLVSAPWLDALAARCDRARARALFALTYDGRIEFDERDADDDAVTALVNRHQRTDKGFGPALGPTAADHAVDAFTKLGYRVERARSDWHVDENHRALRDALITDWVSAACATAPDRTRTVEQWAQRRLRTAATRSRIVVGHADVLARPPAR